MRWAILFLQLLAAPCAAEAAARSAVSAQLARLHQDLRLTSAQEAAWDAYTKAIAPNPAVEARHRATDELLPSLPTPRRIALIAATMAADESDFRKQGEAVSAFYESLTPQQQKTFDSETLPARGTPR
jgi:hypothetical protein